MAMKFKPISELHNAKGKCWKTKKQASEDTFNFVSSSLNKQKKIQKNVKRTNFVAQQKYYCDNIE